MIESGIRNRRTGLGDSVKQYVENKTVKAVDFVADNFESLKSFTRRNYVYIKRWIVIFIFFNIMFDLYIIFIKGSYSTSETGHGHPFILKGSQVTLKVFGRTSEADAVIRHPCEMLSLSTIESGVYTNAAGASFLVSNLFDVQKRMVAGKYSTAVSPKMLNISATECSSESIHAPPGGNGSNLAVHSQTAPNPCTLLMTTERGETVYMVNPEYRTSKNDPSKMVLVKDDMFPNSEAFWVSCRYLLHLRFRDWSSRNFVTEDVTGRDACVLYLSLSLLVYGKTPYEMREPIL